MSGYARWGVSSQGPRSLRGQRGARGTLGRRAFLAAAGLGVAGLAACGRADAASGGAVTSATYIPKSYDDLYPGIQTFMDTVARASGGRLTCDMYNAGTLLGAEEIEGETVKALGGAPVFMGSSEIFEALERGTIDGLMSYLGTVVSRDLQEIVRYGTRAHFGAYTVDAYCRTDWYDAQPPELR